MHALVSVSKLLYFHFELAIFDCKRTASVMALLLVLINGVRGFWKRFLSSFFWELTMFSGADNVIAFFWDFYYANIAVLFSPSAWSKFCAVKLRKLMLCLIVS